jgi:hypothetical protein
LDHVRGERTNTPPDPSDLLDDLLGEHGESEKVEVPDRLGSEEGAYVAFVIGGSAEIVSTFPVSGPPEAGRKGRRGWSPLPLVIEPDEVEATVRALVLRTYAVTPSVVEGEAGLTGEITSSRNLLLDPARILRMAEVSPWVSLGLITPREMKEGLKAAAIPAYAREDDYGPAGVRSVGYVSPELAQEIVAGLGQASTGDLSSPLDLEFLIDETA